MNCRIDSLGKYHLGNSLRYVVQYIQTDQNKRFCRSIKMISSEIAANTYENCFISKQTFIVDSNSTPLFVHFSYVANTTSFILIY